jgi:hypothetical protein
MREKVAKALPVPALVQQLPLVVPLSPTTPLVPPLVQQLPAVVPLSPTTPLFSPALATITPTEIPKRRRVRISPIFLAMSQILIPSQLALDPKVIATGFEQDGQQTPIAGQVASLTSSNNFINFCLTVGNKPITNGQQIKTGSCNPAPMGVIAATTNMPSSKFVSPVNGQDFGVNTAFDIKMAVNHLQTGNFVNAAANYYSAPQQVNGAGDIIGHTHFTVQDVGSITSTTPLDPTVFAFFKGVNGAAVGGVVTESVTAGLPAGTYRVCSINTDANHTPCLVAVAQHGSLDDCVYVSGTLSMCRVIRLICVRSSPLVVLGTTTPSPAMAMVAEPEPEPAMAQPMLPLLLRHLLPLLPRHLLLLQPRVQRLVMAARVLPRLRLLPLPQPQVQRLVMVERAGRRVDEDAKTAALGVITDMWDVRETVRHHAG